MSFAFVVFHYPTPEGREQLAESMREMATSMRSAHGLLSVDPPWYDAAADALIGFSRWRDRAAFEAAVTLRNDTDIRPGERAPRRRYLLEEAPTARVNPKAP